MFCIQCGAYNPVSATFCGSCGSRLEQAAGLPQANVVNQPATPLPQVPPGNSPQSLAGEFTPIRQEMPPASGFLASQASPPAQGIGQTGYGMHQSYQPSAPAPYSPFEPTVPYPPPASQPNLPPNGAPEAPPTLPPAEREPWYKALPRPLPLWAFIGSIVAVVVVLVVLEITGSDWAVGATRVGIVAGILALVIAVATGVRILLGMAAKTNPKRVIQLVSAGLSILLLLLLCLVGLTQQSTIHSLQAHAWEGQQQWQSSINEYQLAGESTPTSENIARVYNEWGEQFSAQQHYEQALVKFDIVLNSYDSATAEFKRAQSDKVAAYLNWGKQADQQKDYASATMRYDALLQLPYCNSNCQSEASMLDATAYYNLAESQLASQDYTDATTDFGLVVSRFPSSPEAVKLHIDYAKALFGEGKQQLTSSCPSAVPTYQQLANQFADTPEGQQAAAALTAPQAVKGHFTTSVPTDPALLVFAALMHGLYPGYAQDHHDQFFQQLDNDPATPIQSNGTFTFKPLKQGTYDLVWGTINTTSGNELVYYLRSDLTVFEFTLGPLCTYDLGNINENVPVAQ